MQLRNTNPEIEVQKITIKKGIRALVLSPKKPFQNATAVLWYHGGGYLVGMKEMVYISRAVDLVTKFSAVVIAPDYRLAWLHPYPAALNDCYAALLHVKQHASELRIWDDQIMVGGESAGGGLCAAVCLYARDKGEVNIAYQIPLYPMLDNLDTETSRDNHGKMWNTTENHFAWRVYLRKQAKSESAPIYAAPARAADYSGLPPAYTFAATGEPFLQETKDYIQALQDAGVEASLDIYKSNMHAFDMMKPRLAISRIAAERFNEKFAYAQAHYFAPQEREPNHTQEGTK